MLAGAAISSRGIIRTSSGPAWATEWHLFKKRKKKKQEKPTCSAEIILGVFYLSKITIKKSQLKENFHIGVTYTW